MSKWKCENQKCEKLCYAELPERCHPTGCLLSKNNNPNWRKEDEPVTNCNQLPKLTAEVFNRPDCPAWAKYAAVDASGLAYYYSESPFVLSDAFGWGMVCSNNNQCAIIPEKFTHINWSESLIERPEKKTPPDWCKLGEWMWIKDFNAYFKVDRLDGLLARGKDFCGSNYSVAIENIRQARLRPYNAKEMRGLVGKVIEGKDEISVITDYSRDNNKIYFIGGWSSADEILKQGYTIDGKPCGVLEHLENGEWVK